MSIPKKLNQLLLITTMATGLVLLPMQSLAASDKENENKGLTIAKERKQRNLGWLDSEAETTMILRNSHGDQSTRKMRLRTLEVDGDGDKGLTIFDEPRDVKGTAFLNFSHATEPDDQWLYLPALKRVKRIASRNKSGPFMGSEFSYEDLSSFEIDKYHHNYLKDETFAGQDCFVVEQKPTDPNSGYTKMHVWVDKAHYRAQKIAFYDRKDTLLKTLTLEDYKQYLDQYWRAHTMKIINHQTGKSTDLVTNEIKFKTGLDVADFTEASLKRAR